MKALFVSVTMMFVFGVVASVCLAVSLTYGPEDRGAYIAFGAVAGMVALLQLCFAVVNFTILLLEKRKEEKEKAQMSQPTQRTRQRTTN